MPDYLFNWNYRSSYGAGAVGDVVAMDEETAGAINRDSPGVLSRMETGRADRMMRGGETRAPSNAELTEIRGIGPALAETLKANGIATVKDLAGKTPGELSEIEGISFTKAAGFIEQAKGLLKAAGHVEDRGGGETINRSNFKAVKGGN